MKTSAYLTPRLRELVFAVESANLRVLREQDDEAIHDLRVALRRLRTLLRLSKDLYGAFHIDVIREALGAAADATGELRDEEVLEETLRSLQVEEPARHELDVWISRRSQREKTLRETVKKTLASGALERPLAWLTALLGLPVRPERDELITEFARKAARRAQKAVDEGAVVDPTDIEGMHRLRILYKRLRYALEGLAPALPPITADGASVAAKFQKKLGELHDVDVAIQTLRDSRSPSPVVRDQVIAALLVERDRCVQRYLAEVEKRNAQNLIDPVVPPTVLAKETAAPAQSEASVTATEASAPSAPEVAPRKRGRPRKTPLATTTQASGPSSAGVAASASPAQPTAKTPAKTPAKNAVTTGAQAKVVTTSGAVPGAGSSTESTHAPAKVRATRKTSHAATARK